MSSSKGFVPIYPRYERRLDELPQYGEIAKVISYSGHVAQGPIIKIYRGVKKHEYRAAVKCPTAHDPQNFEVGFLGSYSDDED